MAIRMRRDDPPTEADLVALARHRFILGERLDIAGMAEGLGISRATAYRWAGGNVDTLTGKVIATLAEDTFHRSVREAKGRGAARVLDVTSRGLRYMSSYRPYRTWLEGEDPTTAMRIVASNYSPVQATMIRLNQGLLEQEMARGMRLAVDAHTMAYAIVRISEAFLYADLIAGEEPDVEKAVEILRLLLA
jgi:tetracycline repressor-like protein